jgi:hypothetical protein
VQSDSLLARSPVNSVRNRTVDLYRYVFVDIIIRYVRMGDVSIIVIGNDQIFCLNGSNINTNFLYITSTFAKLFRESRY